MALSEQERRVIADIGAQELIELSRGLVAVPSETGNEGKCSALVQDLMARVGMKVHGVEAEPGRPNAYGVLKGVGNGPSLQLSAHLDTVPAGDRSRWQVDPYAGAVVDGKLFGRGAMDSKGGGVASAIVALRALQRNGVRTRGDVYFVATVDEEVGGAAGMGFLARRGLLVADYFLNCVHSDLEIKAHFKGVVRAVVTFLGETAHGSTPHRGVNAAVVASRFVDRLMLAGMPSPPDPIMGRSTVSLGWMSTGVDRRFNVVAPRCEVGLDLRLSRNDPCGEVQQRLRDAVAAACAEFPGANAEVVFPTARGCVSVPDDDRLLNQVRECARLALGEAPPVTSTISTGDLTHVFALGKRGIGFGPGDLDRGNAHKENEFLEVDQLVAASRVYAVTIMRVCGVAQD
ncbi:MAG: M20 family metallopeptidase [bacterium]|nr:M20 family metallopeptidase [bacterium]